MILLTQKEYDDARSPAGKMVYVVTYLTWDGPEFIAVTSTEELANLAVGSDMAKNKGRKEVHYEIDLETVQ